MPLILTHGGPGSVFEFLEAIDLLSDPTRFGGRADDAFDVVVPSIPGFGFSSKPTVPIGPPTVARLWHLQTHRSYRSPHGRSPVAQAHDRGAGPPDNELTDEERVWRKAAATYAAQEFDYFNEQRHKPGTVSFALYDNPVGTAAWIVEKFKVWSDSGDHIERAFTKDQLLTNVMIYLVNDTSATSVWFYRGSADDDSGVVTSGKPTVPMGFASFPSEMVLLNPPRIVLERNFNLVHYTKMPKGGHFACFEQPRLFVDDVRQFFHTLRS